MKLLLMQSESLKSTWTDKVNTTEIFTVNIEDISRNEYDTAYFLMSEKRRRKCDALRFLDDKKRCIAADMLLRRVLAEKTGLSENALVFGVYDNGKPYLVGEKYFFSISHSGKYVCVAVNREKPVGVDIEEIKSVNSRIAKRVFSESDMCYVFENSEYPDCIISDPSVLERFFRVWTYKEAYVKMTGEGIDDNIRNISYVPENCHCELSDGYCISVVTKE